MALDAHPRVLIAGIYIRPYKLGRIHAYFSFQQYRYIAAFHSGVISITIYKFILIFKYDLAPCYPIILSVYIVNRKCISSIVFIVIINLLSNTKKNYCYYGMKSIYFFIREL